MNMANPLSPAKLKVNSDQTIMSKQSLQGPTWNLAWNDATPAKQHMARKLKNT